MSIEEKKERIKFNTEMIKLIGIFIIGTATGTFSFLIKGITSSREFILCLIGMTVIIVFVFICLMTLKNTYRILKTL